MRHTIEKIMQVTVIHISMTLSNYFSDQLCFEQKIKEMVDSGDIMPTDTDKKNEEWESQEWQLQMNVLPKKIRSALIRFHVCTVLMRFYEFVVARQVLRVDRDVAMGAPVPVLRKIKWRHSSNSLQERAVAIMDRLTRDPFQASLRTLKILHRHKHANGRVILSTDRTEITTSCELAKRMFLTCMWANIIPFLAELSVQQGVLIYGYGAYYMAKHRRRKKRESAVTGGSKCEGEEDKHDKSVYALLLFFRSHHLTVARSASWLAASAGGAVGSVVLPGWGAVFGIQIGDAVAGALFD